MNAYVDKVFELEQVRNSTKQLRTILYAKYKKSDLNKLMKNKCQNIFEEKRNELHKLLQKSEVF